MQNHKRFYFVVFLLLLCVLGHAGNALELSVGKISFLQTGNTIQLQIDLNNPSEFRAFVISDPYRIVVDLPSYSWNASTIDKPENFVVTDIRQGPLQKGISRIVFDLSAPVQILKTSNEASNKIIINFSKATPEIFRAHKNDVFGKLRPDAEPSPALKEVIARIPTEQNFLKPATLVTKSDPAVPRPPPEPQSKQKPAKSPQLKPLIVIDPGHGGIDPGAIGANKKKEKNVVLALGLELREALLATGRYRVEMTRENDTFLALKERVQFARAKSADLFISLHADSIHKPDVHGTSVYTLSKEASDAQTAKLAEKENKADLIAGIDLSVEDEQVAYILGDFLITETLNQSKFFANTLVARLKDKGIFVLDNAHRYAGFAVLKAPDIPSILVEAGFMSNKSEADLLVQDSHRKKLALALTSGINAYFDHIEPFNKSP